MASTDPQKKLKKLLEEPAVKEWRSLMFSFKTLYKEFEEALLQEGCSYARFQILFFLYFEGAHAPISLSRKLLVTRANISTFLKRMKQDGLIKEVPSKKSNKRPDYSLTAKGEKAFEEIFPQHVRRIKKGMKDFKNRPF